MDFNLSLNIGTVIIFIILISLVSWTFNYFTIGFDSTDNHKTKERSELTLYTDYDTGLQYIRGGLFGGLQPRLNSDGTHRTITQDTKEQ